jgi:hypothetical protein
MDDFRFSLLQLLRRAPVAAARERRWRRPHPAVAAVAARDSSERPLGCGWFDSSFDLSSGLVVHEHATPEVLDAEWALARWLDRELAPRPVAAAAAAAAAA